MVIHKISFYNQNTKLNHVKCKEANNNKRLDMDLDNRVERKLDVDEIFFQHIVEGGEHEWPSYGGKYKDH